MTLTVVKKDLFTTDSSYALAHCISADYGMAAGIAVEFNRRFDARRECFNAKMKPSIPDSVYFYHKRTGICIFNLVTKSKYWHKPDYDSLRGSLEVMKRDIEILGVTKLAIPKIGCGIDKLTWGKVKRIIEDVFKDIDNLEILVCVKEGR